MKMRLFKGVLGLPQANAIKIAYICGVHRLSPHFLERLLGWAGLWKASVPRGRDVQESGLLAEDR
jgi:hypothetical protein